MLFWLCGVSGILYFGFTHIRLSHSVPAVGWSIHDDQEYEMVGEETLPDFPTPVVVSDKRGRAKWTVSIPPSYEFPLEPEIYKEICLQSMEASNHVMDLHKYKHVTHQAHYDYYHVDPYFMDVAEAEKHGMLPSPGSMVSSSSWDLVRNEKDGSIIGENKDELVDKDICEKSMTFIMESSDAGLGQTMLLLWMAYGLAQKEERAFFVDDSRWYVRYFAACGILLTFIRAYGKYTNFFKPPPAPNCRPPPRHEMLPCPHHARHLVVSASTRRWSFGGAFNEHFEDPRKMEVYRQKPIFELARAGYEALFQLAESDSSYVQNRIMELVAKTVHVPPETQDGIIIGIHVRHGDCHPMEFQYSDSYIPLDRYTEKARVLLHTSFNSSAPNGDENLMAEMRSIMVLASDDPDVYDSEEFSHASRAQQLIHLASRSIIATPVLEPTGNSLFKRFVEESVGWEGGFFAGMFWSLGRSDVTPTSEPLDPKVQPTAEATRLRELVGRAYLMDLAVLGGVSDAIVCTVSSMGCKLLAVMMGWEKSIENKGWINIDGEFEWRAVSW